MTCNGSPDVRQPVMIFVSGAEEGFLGGVVLGHFEDDSSVCKGSIIVLRLDSSVAAVEEKSDCVHCAFGAS